MILRAWEDADIEKLASLEKECFSDPWQVSAFKSGLLAPYLFGILGEENGEIIAYGCLSVLFETAEILNIAVEKNARGKGYGKTLLQKMLKLAKEKGAAECFLEVRVSNTVAKNLYEGIGFLPVNIRKGYYANGEDALVMRKEL